ncbi:ABC transporter substrate-binding protein [Flagellimonas sediminis]|uniref:ABC transporter substrate-binding protein n=1 Tax=Flagellimonas sediminis TaxID=2696468 RepID=A0A6I5L1A9_9FLAO|nr:ABC transporter substrate-binding protein [Allomuricauda sediminis]NDV43978.1 ABC transporter substrate-binding protein [Allomuricauda sediminis]
MVRKHHITAWVLFLFCTLFVECKENQSADISQPEASKSSITYAQGFTVQKLEDYTVLEVTQPWVGANTHYKYALVPKEKLAAMTFPKGEYDAIVGTPVEKIVVTSTTHIAAIEALGELKTLVGFPDTDYISSPAGRKRVDEGQIKDLGMNEVINTEMVLVLNPELIIGFSINEDNNAYDVIKRAGIPVVYNGDWVEQTPLGKAEWIKFFAPFFQKEAKADSIFKSIESSYLQAKDLAKKATQKPTVITGGLYKDVWYVAGGKSWMAQFLEDANADYLWAGGPETGSIGLSLESVLEKGQQADFWFNPSSHTSYAELESVNAHHKEFAAFSNKKIYSNAIEKGAKGGLLFYEQAPQRPDIVLQDFIAILHPELLPNHQLRFIKPLE